MSQNIWEDKRDALHKQKRRAQLVSSYLKRSFDKRILDIGCAEGYATSFIAKTGALVIGVEVERTLCKKGTLIVSVPYNERIIGTKCIHCGKVTPLYDHLHSLDEAGVNKILSQSQYKLFRTYRLPNVEIIC